MLCGVLHVAYETTEKVKGQFMVCILYRSSLVLATATKGDSEYTVVAVIPLLNGSAEQSDNGRGMSFGCSVSCFV